MPLPAIDNFNRAALGTDWSHFYNTMGIDSSIRLVGLAADVHGSYYNAETLPNDQYVKVKVIAGASTVKGGPACRMGNAGTGAEFYFAEAYPTGVDITRKMPTGYSYITSFSTTVASGDLIEIRMVGTEIKVYQNGSLLGTANDGTLAGGQGGVFVYYDMSNHAYFDDFEAGSMAATVPGGFFPVSRRQAVDYRRDVFRRRAI